jgi:hypothetical protein
MFSALGILATVTFLVFASNRPEENSFITKKELNYIHEQLENEGLKKKKVNLKPLLNIIVKN